MASGNRVNPRLAACAVAMATGLAAAGGAVAQTTTLGTGMGSCPSQQTVMASTSTSATKGYLCANEYHKGDSSIGALDTQSFTQATNVLYWPSYYCSDQSSTKYVTIAGPAQMWGSGSYSATNWDPTTNHYWSAGFVYTLEAGSVSNFNPQCDSHSTAAWVYPPVMEQLTNISATGLPNNGQATAGQAYTITATATPGGSAANEPAVLTDNGVTVAGGYMNSNGQVTFKWTPAQMGSRKVLVEWPGTTTALGAYTNTYTVNVSGGTALSVSPNVVWSSTNETGVVTVDVDTSPNPIPSAMKVMLVDASNSQPVAAVPASVTPSSAGSSTGTATLTLKYQSGRIYKMVAVVQADSANGVSAGQSYVTQIGAPGGVVPEAPPHRPSRPGGGAYPVPMAYSAKGMGAMEKSGRHTAPPSLPTSDQKAVDLATSTVEASRRVTSKGRTLRISCPAGTFPLHAEGWTNGSDPKVRVSFSARGATITSSAANVGSRLSAYGLCKKADVAGMIVYSNIFGSIQDDNIQSGTTRAFALGGPGNDGVRLTGAQATGWGGQGGDVMSTKGRDSSINGGPGRDRLTALGTKRVLLVGGPGPDVLIGSKGPARINSADGESGDRVICKSASTLALVDAGDIVTGPCTVRMSGS